MTIDLKPILNNALSLNSNNVFGKPEDLFNKQIPAIFLVTALNDFKFPCMDLSRGFSELSIQNIVKTDLGKEVVAQCYYLSPKMIADKLQNILLDVSFPYDKPWNFNAVLRFAKQAQSELEKNSKTWNFGWETKVEIPRSYTLLKAALGRLQGDQFAQQVLSTQDAIINSKSPEDRKAAILLLQLLIKKDPFAAVVRRLFIDDVDRKVWQPFYSAVLKSEDPILKDLGLGLKDFWLNALREDLKQLPGKPSENSKTGFQYISDLFWAFTTSE